MIPCQPCDCQVNRFLSGFMWRKDYKLNSVMIHFHSMINVTRLMDSIVQAFTLYVPSGVKTYDYKAITLGKKKTIAICYDKMSH